MSLLEKSFQNILKLTKRFYQSKSGCSKTDSLKSQDFVFPRLKTQDSRLKTQDSRLKSILTDSLSNPVTKEIQSRGIWLRIRSYPLEKILWLDNHFGFFDSYLRSIEDPMVDEIILECSILGNQDPDCMGEHD